MNQSATYNPQPMDTGFIEHKHSENLVLQAKRMSQNSDKSEKPEQRVSSGFLNRILIISGLFLLIAAGMYAYATKFGDQISRGGHSADNKAFEIAIGVDRLNVPANAIRFANQRHGGRVGKLDMYLHWPSLEGYSDRLRNEFNRDSDNANLVFLTLEPRSMSFDMSGRVDSIYSRFFKGLAIQQEFGLIRRQLDPEGGFIDEDLYFDPTNPYPYAARCVRDNSKIAIAFCIRDIHIGRDMALTYRFHKKFLPKWIELEQALRAHVKSLIIDLK